MDPSVLRQELLELLLLIQHLNPTQVKPSDGWSQLLYQYLHKCSKEQIESLVTLSSKQSDFDQDHLRKTLDPLATECQLNPQVVESLFNLTLELYYLQNLLQNLSILQLMKLFEVIPSGPSIQQKQLVQQIQKLFSELQPDTVMNMHRQLQQAALGTEQETLAQLLELPKEHFQLDLDELLKLQAVLPQFQPVQVKLLLQLLQLQPFDVLQYRDLLDSVIQESQDLDSISLVTTPSMVNNQQHPQPPAPPEKRYTLQIVEQPPEKSVYKRNLKPNPMVTIQGDAKLLPNLYIAVTLIRCDTFQEEAKFLSGNRPERVTTGRVVTFRKLKITTTSHQQQETLFCLRFELRKYHNETEFEVLDTNHSNPVCVLSHSTQMKPVPTVAPVITEVIPSCGPPVGGTRVAILGNNFVESPAARIRFDQTDVMPIFHGPGTLICHTPQHQPGAVSVRVCNSNKKWSDSASTFTYDASLDSFRDPMQDAILARNPNFEGSTIGEATWSGGFDAVRRLQETGASVNNVDSRGYTALHYACALGNTEIANFLLEKNAQANIQDKEGNTALLWAVAYAHEEVVQLLIDHGANLNISSFNGVSPLHAAAFNADISISTLLLDHGAQVNSVMVEGQSPLHIAAVTSSQLVTEMLRYGAFANATDIDGDTALHWAVREGDVQSVKALIAGSACVDVVNDDDETPVLLAAQFGDRGIFDVLLMCGADVTSCDQNGASVAHYIGYLGQENVHSLVKAGADINVQDLHGDTPLHYLARFMDAKLVERVLSEMLSEGADLGIKNEDGKTAAAAANLTEVGQIFQNQQKQRSSVHQEKLEKIMGLQEKEKKQSPFGDGSFRFLGNVEQVEISGPRVKRLFLPLVM